MCDTMHECEEIQVFKKCKVCQRSDCCDVYKDGSFNAIVYDGEQATSM